VHINNKQNFERRIKNMDLIILLLVGAAFVLVAMLTWFLITKKTKQVTQQTQEQVQAQLVDPERMQLVHNSTGTAIYRDTQTGVQYLMVSRGWHGVSLTPMLDRDGKPLAG